MNVISFCWQDQILNHILRHTKLTSSLKFSLKKNSAPAGAAQAATRNAERDNFILVLFCWVLWSQREKKGGSVDFVFPMLSSAFWVLLALRAQTAFGWFSVLNQGCNSQSKRRNKFPAVRSSTWQNLFLKTTNIVKLCNNEP